ncbi:MAG: AAA family ATPase [Methylococcales bacterium]
MHTFTPPGFTSYPFGYRNDHLLLPKSLVKLLAKQDKLAKESMEDDFQKAEVENLIHELLENSDLSVQQLHSNFLAFNKQQQAKSTTKPADFKFSDVKYLKIFDAETIHQRKKDSGFTRNVQAVMKRFKDADDGQRILKTVPADFKVALQHLKAQYPNCINFIDYVESFAMLALKQAYPAFYFPPVLLVGPPGIGKTAAVNAVAEIIGVSSRQIDLAATTAGMVLGGMSTQWSDAKTGVIIDLLRDEEAANPIVILDEIDKAAADAKHNPLGSLYSLLEQKTAGKFIDEALDLPADASHVLYVATANTLETIPKPILSRFISIEIYAITPEQHSKVTQSIYTGLLQQHDCTALFAKKLATPVVNALRNFSPRVIKSTLRRALAQAAQRNRNGKKLTVIEADLLFSNISMLKSSCYDRSRPIGFMQ